MTKDERLLKELYLKMLSTKKKYVDPFEIGRLLGYKEHLIKNILKGLMQANLVKRGDRDDVTVTLLGQDIAKKLNG